MTRKYVLRPSPSDENVKKLERSFKKAHKIIERAQKRTSRTGKDKSLLRCAVALGFIVNKAPINLNGMKYVNPMTSGDRLYLEEVGTYKCIEFVNNTFTDSTGKLVYIDGYK